MAQHADGKPADDVDDGDDEGRDRVAAHEFRRAIHRAVEGAFLLELTASFARHLLLDQPRREIGVDRHLLARHGVEAEAGGDLGDAAGALGDDHEINHQQDREQDHADQHVPAHQQSTEGGHHMAGGQHALAAVLQDQPGGGDVERQAEQGREQQQSLRVKK